MAHYPSIISLFHNPVVCCSFYTLSSWRLVSTCIQGVREPWLLSLLVNDKNSCWCHQCVCDEAQGCLLHLHRAVLFYYVSVLCVTSVQTSHCWQLRYICSPSAGSTHRPSCFSRIWNEDRLSHRSIVKKHSLDQSYLHCSQPWRAMSYSYLRKTSKSSLTVN